MIEIPDDQYVEYVQLRKAKRAPVARDSWWTKFFIIGVLLLLCLLTADHFKLIPQSLIDKVLPAAQTTYSTPQASPGGAGRQEPPSSPLPRFTPFYGGAVIAGELATVEPTATSEAASSSFYTPEEQAAFQATDEAFYTEIPTAEPAFIEYVDERCKDAGAVEESRTLQLFCGGAK